MKDVYLSRLALNPLNARIQALSSDPYLIHKRLCEALGRCRADAGLLFRIDEVSGGLDLLVQTTEEPDWSNLELPLGALRFPIEEPKPLTLGLPVGTQLGFRLLARPAKREFIRGGSGKRQDLKSDDERLDWLKRKGLDSGFSLEQCSLTDFSWRSTKDPKESRNLSAVRFDGVLTVVDTGLIGEATSNGIGPGKAFGFGMLSLSRTA